MTKKFWKSWQNRIGETKNIILNTTIVNPNNGRTYYHYVLSTLYDDKIIKASFNMYSVDLTIKRIRPKGDHFIDITEYLTLHRNEINSVEFHKLLKI